MQYWTLAEIDRLARIHGIRPGCVFQGEDYHFPNRDFLVGGYAPPGGYVKDFGVIRHAGRLHLFHIDGRPGERCWATGNEISIGHASTADYRHWIRHMMPLAVGERSWESEHIWAPYIYEQDGRYYLFYMGSGKGETYISYATSTDLNRWSRWPDGPIRSAVGRDPFVWHDGRRHILLYTGHGGARVAACASSDLVNWLALSDVLYIPGGKAIESCSMYPLNGHYVLWFNDYGPELAGFRAAYIFSDDPFHFTADQIRTFRFETHSPEVTPSPELCVQSITPVSLELVERRSYNWLIAYFRWQLDRNRLFFGLIDWSEDPAVIRECDTVPET
jgi:sucrose-6-phosphate hydrolase SacC (GH32 family)